MATCCLDCAVLSCHNPLACRVSMFLRESTLCQETSEHACILSSILLHVRRLENCTNQFVSHRPSQTHMSALASGSLCCASDLTCNSFA